MIFFVRKDAVIIVNLFCNTSLFMNDIFSIIRSFCVPNYKNCLLDYKRTFRIIVFLNFLFQLNGLQVLSQSKDDLLNVIPNSPTASTMLINNQYSPSLYSGNNYITIDLGKLSIKGVNVAVLLGYS